MSGVDLIILYPVGGFEFCGLHCQYGVYISDIRLEVSLPLFRGCSWSNGLQQIVVVDHTYSYTRAIVGYLDRQEIW